VAQQPGHRRRREPVPIAGLVSALLAACGPQSVAPREARQAPTRAAASASAKADLSQRADRRRGWCRAGSHRSPRQRNGNPQLVSTQAPPRPARSCADSFLSESGCASAVNTAQSSGRGSGRVRATRFAQTPMATRPSLRDCARGISSPLACTSTPSRSGPGWRGQAVQPDRPLPRPGDPRRTSPLSIRQHRRQSP